MNRQKLLLLVEKIAISPSVVFNKYMGPKTYLCAYKELKITAIHYTNKS